MDMEGATERLNEFNSHFDEDTTIIPISALTNDNLKDLVYKCSELLEVTPFFYKKDEVVNDYVEYNFAEEEKDIVIQKVKDDTFDVRGKLVQKLVNRSNFMTDESISMFLTTLRKAGLDDQLREAGAKNGDTITIFDLEFEFVE